MEDQTAGEGRTVLFVSHQLASIKRLTQRCIWLDHGRIREIGPTDEVFRGYMLAHGTEGGQGVVDLSDLSRHRAPKQLEQKVTFETVELRNPDGVTTDAHLEGEPMLVRVQLRCRTPIDEEFEIFARIHTLDNVVVLSALGGRRPVALEEDRLYETSFSIDPNPLRPGAYRIELYCLTRIAQDLIPSAISFRVEGNPQPGDDPRWAFAMDLGVVRGDYPWAPLSTVD
jgi:lipopolysaccharide transport system ATP-binding protein